MAGDAVNEQTQCCQEPWREPGIEYGKCPPVVEAESAHPAQAAPRILPNGF